MAERTCTCGIGRPQDCPQEAHRPIDWRGRAEAAEAEIERLREALRVIERACDASLYENEMPYSMMAGAARGIARSALQEHEDG